MLQIVIVFCFHRNHALAAAALDAPAVQKNPLDIPLMRNRKNNIGIVNQIFVA